MTTRTTFTAIATAALVGILALTGCGATDTPDPTPSATTPAVSASPTPLPPTTPTPQPSETTDPAEEPGAGTDYAENTVLYEFPAGETTYTPVAGNELTCPAEDGVPASAISVQVTRADDDSILSVQGFSCLYDAAIDGDDGSGDFFDMGEEG